MSTDLTIFDTLVQGSQDWFDARCGLVTASVAGGLITARKLGAIEHMCPECEAFASDPCVSLVRKGATPIKTFHASRHAVALEADITVLEPADNDTSRGIHLSLAAERITHNVEEMPMSRAMERGHIEEPLARAAYAEHKKVTVDQVGFMVRDFGTFRLGFSPDGLVGEVGAIEIKSRGQKPQVATVIADEVPAANVPQIQAGLLVSGREWVDYVSYSGGMELWDKRVYPDPAWHAAIVAATRQAEERITDIVIRYTRAVAGLPLMDRTPDIDSLGLEF